MTLASQVRAALGAVVVLLLAILAAAFYVPYELNASSNEKYVHDVIPLRGLVQDLVLQMATEHASVEAYLATGDRRTLNRYLSGSAAANRDLAAMQPYLRRHPEIDRLVQEAVPEISDLEGQFAQQIAFAESGDTRHGPQAATVNAKFEQFQATAQRMIRQTERFVQQAARAQRSTYRRLLVVLGILGGVALTIGALLFWTTPRRLGELYAAEERLRREAESRADAARALEHVGDGVVLTDTDGRIVLWNPAAARLLALGENAVGRRVAEVVPAWTPAEAPERTILPVQVADGEHWLDVTSVDFGEGVVYALHDVTAERALERMKSDLVATVSHELRTPMTTIYGAAATLRREDVELRPADHRELLRLVESESSRLARIVDDILLASRLESGAVDLATERCDPSELARSVVESAEVRTPENLALRLELAPGLPPIAADPGRLRQVLLNLVDNAIKYSPEGGDVVVSLSRNGESVRFAVRDEGLGFPADEAERIFTRFYRLDPNHTRGIGGTGLGLYISRELVERMHGRIWAESEPGRGSAFYVVLPLAEPAQRPPG